jgi:hypothetical protein
MQLDADRFTKAAHSTRHHRNLLCHRIVLAKKIGLVEI